MAAAADDRGTWGDEIRAIEHAKKHLSWELNEPSTQVKRINLRERRNQERELDPILMKYRDGDKEEAYMSKKNSFTESILARTASSRSRFNIINHQGPPKPASTVNLERAEKSKESLHLISNLLNKDHIKAPILYDQDYYVTNFVPKVSNKGKPIVRRRDFSIVSNNYYEGHEEKTRSEYEKLQEDVTKKYWETHGYNPVVGQFYSDADEERYSAQLKEVEAMQGSSQASRIPPSVFYSEGKAYNIVNHTVMDEERLATSLTATTRTLNKVRKVQQKAKEVRDHSVAENERQEQRRMHRVKFNRWQEGIDRGYDLLHNASFDMTNPATSKRKLPLPSRPSTVYDQLRTSDSMLASVGKFQATEGSGASRDLSGRGDVQEPAATSSGGRMIATAGDVVRSGRASGNASARTMDSARSGGSGMYSVSARSTGSGMGDRALTSQSSRGRSVPRLEMSRVEPGDAVGYIDNNATGPPGVAIPMVRTGGLSGMRS